MNIAQPGARPKLTLKPCTPAAQPIPADQLAAIERRAASCAVPIERFYLVWALSKRPPKYRHTTLDAAKAEAARLRGLNPGISYLVYRCEVQS